ncbi:MAG: YbjN domain-containing protein [Phascolarctobacterium sp.]|nr:YbjN domain-containing protein [Phascolarctobacterium sp.]MBR6636535.1 YbjN domain-containing protein [Phascolarctobacterium sp.]
MENVINAKTLKLKDFFAENKIECFQVEERNDENETAVFRSLMQVKGQTLPFAVLVDKSVYALLQVQLAPALVKGEAFAKIAAFLNEMNNNYRVFKFVTTNEGDLLLNACIVSKDDAFDPALVNAIIAETVKFLEAEYATVMAKVWEEIK